MLSDVFEQWLKRSQKEKGIAIGMEIGLQRRKDIGKESLSESNGGWNREVARVEICGVNLHSRKAANSTNYHQMA